MAFQPYYNPYASFNPQYQPPQFQPPAQPTPQPQQQPEAFLCRPVTSREEAVATPVDFQRPTLLPDMAHGKIYLKSFNSSTGASDFFEFAVAEPPKQAAPQYVTIEDFNALKEEFEKLKKPVKGKKSDDE